MDRRFCAEEVTTVGKARGKKHPWTDADKERALAVYATCGNLSKTYRETGVPISTLRGWLAEKPSEEVQKARTDAKKRFVEEAWDTISKAIATGNTVMSFALENKGRIDEAIKTVAGSPDIDRRHKGPVILALLELTKFDMRELANYIGVVYDKIALATGKPTGINRLEGQVTETREFRITQEIISQNPRALDVIFTRDQQRDVEGLGS